MFRLDVEHTFFSSGTPGDLDFIPTPKSSVILKNAGLLNRRTARGLSVFYDLARAEALQLYASDPDEPLSFEFKIFSSNRSFDLYTEPAPTQPEAILHFDTKMAKLDGSSRLRLHEQDYVSQKDFAPLTSPLFNELLSPKDRHVKPILTVTIHGEDLGIRPHDHPPEVVSKRYYIRFKTREIVWKYYLLGTIAKRNAYIADMNNETEFELAGEAVLSDDRTALAFRSKHPLPLRERSDYRFQLRERGPGGGKILIQRLPVASADQFYRETIDGKNVAVSEVYINY